MFWNLLELSADLRELNCVYFLEQRTNFFFAKGIKDIFFCFQKQIPHQSIGGTNLQLMDLSMLI
jgi:hypothetical protein